MKTWKISWDSFIDRQIDRQSTSRIQMQTPTHTHSHAHKQTHTQCGYKYLSEFEIRDSVNFSSRRIKTFMKKSFLAKFACLNSQAAAYVRRTKQNKKNWKGELKSSKPNVEFSLFYEDSGINSLKLESSHRNFFPGQSPTGQLQHLKSTVFARRRCRNARLKQPGAWL